ncbi:MAG TPA: hypothetical protein VNI84_18780 [Pyrinomonadaceae bacterium]|nr:hypothetical protein [Pyrinomonadaceae bacterium]
MTKPKFIFIVAAFFLVCLVCSIDSFGQAPNKQQTEPSYEVVLQVLIASNAANDKSTVPPTLSNVVKKLKTTYSFSNYRVASTYLQRVANTGTVEFRSVSTETNQNNFAPIFSDWTLNGLQSLINQRGQNSIQFQSFRFGQRIPIRTASGVVNYEQVGLTIQRFGLPENTPTVIGTLSTSKSDELMFLILTVKPTE